jgi:hypothetical protein
MLSAQDSFSQPSSTAIILSPENIGLPSPAPVSSKKMPSSPEDGVVITRVQTRPLENKALASFTSPQQLPHETYHVIKRAEYIQDGEVSVFYLKVKANLSELEAALAAHYKLLAPNYVPATYAVYEENKYVGVASAEIYNFRPLSKNPLTIDDLDVSFISRENLSFRDLDCWQEKRRLLEEAAEKSARRKRFLDKNDYELIDKPEQGPLDKFYQDLTSQLKITREEFERFCDLKGLSIGLGVSYIFEEDDCHQNNISKDGKRLDFDMSMWPLVYKINDKGLIASVRRKPRVLARTVAKEDIIHFPDISVVHPFYWPTTETPLFSDETHEILKKIITLPNNRYTSTAVSINKCLSRNPVVNHYKYQTMLKYILSNPSMYEKIALLHMPEETQYQSKLMYKVLADEHEQRIADFERTLIKIPEFIDFFFEYGKSVLDEFLGDLAKHNALYIARAAHLCAEIESLNKRCEAAFVVNDIDLIESIEKEKKEKMDLLKMVKFQEIKTDDVVSTFTETKSVLAITREKNLKKVDSESDCYVVIAKAECEESKEQEQQYLKVKAKVLETISVHSPPSFSNLFNLMPILLVSKCPPNPDAEELLDFCRVVIETDKLAPSEKIKVIEDKLKSIKADGEEKHSGIAGDFLIKINTLLDNTDLWKSSLKTTASVAQFRVT